VTNTSFLFWCAFTLSKTLSYSHQTSHVVTEQGYNNNNINNNNKQQQQQQQQQHQQTQQTTATSTNTTNNNVYVQGTKAFHCE